MGVGLNLPLDDPEDGTNEQMKPWEESRGLWWWPRVKALTAQAQDLEFEFPEAWVSSGRAWELPVILA